MSQPSWKVKWATDMSRLLVDKSGVYAPELEIAEETGENSRGKPMFRVYRISCEPLQLVERNDKAYLVPADWNESWPHPVHQYEAWFAKKLDRVCRSAGCSVDELVGELTSKDPDKLASAYSTIVGYQGAYEFDQSPIELTESQLNKRWAKKS